MMAAALLCALTINDTVLKIGRWPYVVNWPAYSHATQLRAGGTPARIARRDEGVYAVAAANPRITLVDWRSADVGFCPGYNKDGKAFLASIGLGRWPRNLALCGGAAIAPAAPVRR